MIIIQQICTTWTTKSRGAPGSIRRNAVPKSVPVDLEECTFLFERYIFKEWDSFKQEREVHMVKNLIPYRVGNLLLKCQNDELDIGFRWRLTEGVGFPQRHEIKSAFHLSSGMFGRLLINGLERHRGSSTYYSQDIYNIALVGQPTPDFFISCEPDRIIDLRVALDNPSLLG